MNLKSIVKSEFEQSVVKILEVEVPRNFGEVEYSEGKFFTLSWQSTHSSPILVDVFDKYVGVGVDTYFVLFDTEYSRVALKLEQYCYFLNAKFVYGTLVVIFETQIFLIRNRHDGSYDFQEFGLSDVVEEYVITPDLVRLVLQDSNQIILPLFEEGKFHRIQL